MNVTLSSSPQYLVQTVLRDGWLEDGEHNRLFGFGRGEMGLEAALRSLRDGIKSGWIVGFYAALEPFGWCEIREAKHQTAKMKVFLCPSVMADEQVSEEALGLLVSRFYGKPRVAYRLELRTMEYNRPLNRIVADCGWHREGVLWASRWVAGQPQSEVQWVMTPPHWKNVRKDRERRAA